MFWYSSNQFYLIVLMVQQNYFSDLYLAKLLDSFKVQNCSFSAALIFQTNLSTFPYRRYHTDRFLCPLFLLSELKAIGWKCRDVSTRSLFAWDHTLIATFSVISSFPKSWFWNRAERIREMTRRIFYLALRRNFLTLACFQILDLNPRSFQCFYSSYQRSPISFSICYAAAFLSEFLIGCILCVFEAWRWQKFR